MPADGAEDALRGAMDAAEAAGWIVEAEVTAGVTGRKRLSSGDARMVVFLQTDARLMPKGVQPPMVVIDLNHGR